MPDAFHPQFRFHSLAPWPTNNGCALHRDLARSFIVDRVSEPPRGTSPTPITLRKFSWQKDPTQ